MTTTVTATDVDIVRDVDLDPQLPDQWQRRSMARAAFADRQRSIGFRITVGPPA